MEKMTKNWKRDWKILIKIKRIEENKKKFRKN